MFLSRKPHPLNSFVLEHDSLDGSQMKWNGFISHIHVGRSPWKRFEKRRPIQKKDIWKVTGQTSIFFVFFFPDSQTSKLQLEATDAKDQTPQSSVKSWCTAVFNETFTKASQE